MSGEIVERVEEACGIYVRSIFLESPEMIVPQHVHDYDHATYVGAGKARVWVDGIYLGDFAAGQLIPVIAGKLHEFMSLEAGTRLACIHDVASAESAKTVALAQAKVA